MSEQDYGEGFGSVSIEREFNGPKHFKMRMPDPKKNEESTELIARLLPAMHSYKDTKEWCFFYARHFGHAGVNASNPDRPRMRPFKCIERKRNKVVEHHCPKCDQIALKEAQLAKIIREILEKNPEIEEKKVRQSEQYKSDKRIKVLAEWLKNNNCDRKYWVNVMVQSGTKIEFGDLALGYKFVEKVLRPFLKELQEKKGIDAFHPQKGVWLRFVRTASSFNDIVDRVELVTDDVESNGETLQRARRAPMSPEQIKQALATCVDLSKDVVETISVDTMKALIASSGDPEETDRIWPPKKKAEQKPAPGKVNVDLTDLDAEAEEKVESKPAIEKKVEPEPEPAAEPASQEDDEEAAALRAYEEAKAKAAAKKAAAATQQKAPAAKKPAPTPVPEPAEPDNVDDFLAEFPPDENE